MRLAPSTDRAVVELLAAFGRELPDDSPLRLAPPAKDMADLVLQLSEPAIREEEGTRRATARAQLVFRPADPRAPSVESAPFRFVAPLGPIEVEDLAWYLERYSAWPSEHFQVRAKRVEAQLPEWGQRLHAALGLEKAVEVLVAWRSAKEESRRFSVRVNEVSLDGDEEEAKEAATLLLALPWELVHDSRTYLFQGANGVRVRRQRPNRLSLPPLVTEAPIRVLLVSPRPEDEGATYIDHRVSARPLEEALDPLGEMVELSLLRPPTFEALSAELVRANQADQAYDVVHFDGHGVYDKKHGLGALCFEHPDDAAKLAKRRTAMVQADQLAKEMRDHRVPLVFLEACQTGMAKLDPAASVAGQLLDQGVASVVAMSHAVLVETARRFVGAFYQSLMRGERVGEAMLEGQRDLARNTKRGRSFYGDFHLQDWFVPVLYQEENDLPLVTELHGESVKAMLAKRRVLLLGALPEEPPHHFVGRSRELLALERLLEHKGYAVLLGEGGEGKTTLAAELARWLVATRRFARAAFVSVEHALDLRSVLFALGDQLVAGYAAEASREPEKAVLLIERALRERATLVVFDNMESVLPPPEGSAVEVGQAHEPELLTGLLQLCAQLQGAGSTRLLFTSREALPSPFDDHHHTVRIGRLDRKDAVKLVSRVLGEKEARPQRGDAGESEGEVGRLVDAVNCHARSLVLVAREVVASGVRGATDRLEELMAAMAERYGDDREQSLFASVELSLRRLPAETRQQLPRLGVFQGGGHLFVIAQVLGLDYEKDEEVELGRKLVSVGLGELLPYGHLRLHPALGPLLRRELGEAEQEEAQRVWVEAMVDLARYLRQQRSVDVQLAATLTVLELPNLFKALEFLKAISSPEEVVKVATTIEDLLQNLGRPRAMTRVVKIREEMATKLEIWSRERYHAEQATMDRLLEAGQFAEAVKVARALLQRASDSGDEAYEKAAYDIATAHFNLGTALSMSSAAEAALGSFEEARERFQKLGDTGDRDAIGMVMKCIAESGTCLQQLGRFNAAAAAHERSIQLSEELGDRRQRAVSKGELGTIRIYQQRYDDALSALKEARNTFEQLAEPSAVAVAWHQIGRAYEEAQKHEAAEHAYQQALKIRVQQGDRGGEADTLSQLGTLWGNNNRAEDAVRLFRQATKIYTDAGDVGKEGISRSSAAGVLIKLQRYEESRQELMQAIECKKPYGHTVEPWKTFDIRHSLERAEGNATAAARARGKAMAAFLAYRQAGGENHSLGGRLALDVYQAITNGDTAGVEAQLEALAARPELPAEARVFAPIMQQILDGSRDPALASTAGLFFMDAVEVKLLLEQLAESEADQPAARG